MTDWRREPRTWTAIALALLLWASAFPGIRAGMRLTEAGVPGPDGFGPGELALLRFGTASLVLVAWALLTRMRLPALGDVPRIAVAGFLGISIYHVALNFGEVTVSSGAAALLIATGPVFTALLSLFFLHERLAWQGWVGIVVAFGGAVVVALGEGGTRLSPGAALVLLSAVVTAAYFVLSKRPLRRYNALEFTAYAIWFGTLPMLFFAPGLVRQLGDAAPAALWSGVYLGVFPGAISYVLWSYALSRMPASVLASFLYAQPANAALIAWIWLGEVPSLLTVIGGVVAIAGVALVQLRGQIGSD